MVVNNNKEFEDFYPYERQYVNKYDYPKEYPCIVKWDYEGGGLGGEYRQVYVAYFPKNVSIEESFIMGLRDPWERLG